MIDSVPEGLERIRAWGEARDWRGYDPYDALNSPLAGPLSLNTALGRRLLTQTVKLSPLNLRPVLGIRPAWNAKAIALVASGYVRLAHAGDESAGAQAQRWLRWLADAGSGEQPGWGYHFPVQTRVFAYPRGAPNAIATSFVAQAFLDAWELLGDEAAGRRVLDVCDFLLARMRVGGPHPYFRYLTGEDELIHNANVLVCAVLARAARLSGRRDLSALAQAAVATTVAAQRPDGSWPYAAADGNDWVDNFHTAYVLDGLSECARQLPGLEEALDRGVRFWDRELFLADGTPKYFPNRTFPIDAHCYATAIDTWIGLDGRHSEAWARVQRLAGQLVTRMLDRRGFVRFQRRRFWTNRVPLVRWATAPSFRALAGVLCLGAGRDRGVT